MALDENRLRRTCDEALQHVDRAKQEMRSITNDFSNHGQDFRNDRRFSSDAYHLSDRVRNAERALEQLQDLVRTIQRNIR